MTDFQGLPINDNASVSHDIAGVEVGGLFFQGTVPAWAIIDTGEFLAFDSLVTETIPLTGQETHVIITTSGLTPTSLIPVLHYDSGTLDMSVGAITYPLLSPFDRKGPIQGTVETFDNDAAFIIPTGGATALDLTNTGSTADIGWIRCVMPGFELPTRTWSEYRAASLSYEVVGAGATAAVGQVINASSGDLIARFAPGAPSRLVAVTVDVESVTTALTDFDVHIYRSFSTSFSEGDVYTPTLGRVATLEFRAAPTGTEIATVTDGLVAQGTVQGLSLVTEPNGSLGDTYEFVFVAQDAATDVSFVSVNATAEV